MRKFKFLENVAIADVAFEAYGVTPEQLFENAAMALMEVMAETSSIISRQSLVVRLEAPNSTDLLFDFLSELVFLKDRDNLLFSKFKIKIQDLRKIPGIERPKFLVLNSREARVRKSWIEKQETGSWKLEASVFGEPIDPKCHHLKVDVKAVTRHLFELKKEKSRYIVRVVLDI